MQVIREYAIVRNRQLVLELPEHFDRLEVEVIVLPRYAAEDQKTSPGLPKRKTRPLGILKGKAGCIIHDDFKLSDEEFLNL